MEISKTKQQRNSRGEDKPDFIGTPKRNQTTPQYGGNRVSGGGGGGMRRGGSHDDLRVQFEEVKEQNRNLRGQLQVRNVGFKVQMR